MRCSHVCTIAFVLAFMKVLIASTVIAPHLQLEAEPSLDILALGPTSSHDDQFIVKSGSLQSRDLDQAAGYGFSVSKRSLLTDIATTSFRLIWDYMDIAYASYIAFYQTTELWTNMTANARGKWKAEEEVTRLDISYGSLKLSIAGLIDTISWELVAEFAVEMLVLSRDLVSVAFRVILFTNWAVLVISLAVAAQVLGTLKPQQLVVGP